MPHDNFLRFEGDAISRDLPILEQIYHFESSRISGSHGGGRRHTVLRWEKQQMLDYLCDKFPEQHDQIDGILDDLINHMVDEKHMMRYTSGAATYHSTRVGELVRNITCLHEFQQRESGQEDDEIVGKRYSIMDGIRWEPRLRYGPARNIPASLIVENLRNQFSADHELPNGVSLDDALIDLDYVLRAYDQKFNGNLMFSQFQADSIVIELIHSWKGHMSPLVLTAGTGMGKTIAFTIPVLTDALIQNRGAGRRLCSQLLLYPRNDLAKDQFSEIESVIKHLNHLLAEGGQISRSIGIAIDAASLIGTERQYYPTVQGGQELGWGVGGGNVYNSASEIYGGNRPAAIVACSIESFRRRLKIRPVVEGLQLGLKRIVADEVHLSSGTQGAHISNILKRCKKTFGHTERRPISFVGVSATIAKPRKHVSKLWDDREDDERKVRHVDASSSLQMEPMGILHHIMAKDRQHASSIGSLVDITSAVVHHRRVASMERPALYKDLQKTIGFADSHEIVGNWYSYMLDNEVTSSAARMPNHETSMRRPYNQWHDSPLNCHEGGQEVCTSCRSGTYHETPITVSMNQIELIRTDRLPQEVEERFDLRFKTSDSFNITDDGEFVIKGLDTCPHLESGTCWWFVPRTGELEVRPGDQNAFSFKESVRVKRHTSKTQDGNNDQLGGADHSFRERATQGAYPPPPNNLAGAAVNYNHQIKHDVAIATPTLEVGVDMNSVTEVITHKAIRNISSYRQKVGRSGRERGTDALAVTLLSASGQDFHHYRSMRRLVDAKISDPIPIASANRTVLSSEAYDAVIDYITTHSDLPLIEYIGARGIHHPSSLELDENLRLCMDAIYNENTEQSVHACYVYVRDSLRDGLPAAQVHRAIEAVWTHFDKLLTPIRQSAEGEHISALRYVAASNSGQHIPNFDPNLEAWQQLQGAVPLLATMLTPNALEELNGIIECKMVDKFVEFAAGYPILQAFSEQFQTAPDQDPFAEEVTQLCNLEDSHYVTTYLSTLLRALSSMKRSAPFISQETLFLNPHEAAVEVRHEAGNYSKTELITAADALQYTLPGMWTHRLFKAQRFYVCSGRQAIEHFDFPGTGRFRMQMDSQIENGRPPEFDNYGTISNQEVAQTPSLLDITPFTGMQLKQLTRIFVQTDKGVEGKPNTVEFRPDAPYNKQLVSTMDVESGNQFPSRKKRPTSYSISWTFAQPDDEGIPSQTYQIPYTEAGEHGVRSVSVLNHPLMNTIFSHVNFHKRMNVKRIAFGVSRSNNVILQPFKNGHDIAFVDNFSTSGFRFLLNEEFVNKGASGFISRTNPFDGTTLQIISFWMLSQPEFKNQGVNSFLVEAYIDALVDEVWSVGTENVPENAFPRTTEEFLDLWLNNGHAVDQQRLQLRFEQDKVADDLLEGYLEDLQELMGLIGQSSTYILRNWEQIAHNWYTSTCGNTLGLMVAESIAEFAGVQTTSIAYTFDWNAESNELEILVFDNEAEGNGACDLANTYFAMPISIQDIAQHLGETNLPSQSLVDVIERRAAVCEEHYIHSAAIQDEIPSGTKQSDQKEIEELQYRYRETWDELNIQSSSEAGLHFRRRFAETGAQHGEAMNQEQRTKMLDLELALDVCAQSCPSCKGDDSLNAFPTHLSKYTTNRSVIDVALGAWHEREGYLRSHSDRAFIEEGSGHPVPSGLVWHIVHPQTGMTVMHNAVHYPSPPIGYAFQRGQEMPDVLELNTRIMDVI